MRVARLAAEQWGVLSLAELLACGLSPDAVTVRIRNGQLHRLHHGVYAVGHLNLPVNGRFLAAVKACGRGAVLSHFSAAALWSLVRWDGRHPEVTVTGVAARRHPGIRVHRTRRLDRQDVVRHEGIPVTSPARTLVDVASMLPYRSLRRATREAQSRLRVNLRQLGETLDRLGARRGVRNLRRILATGPAPTQSELEDLVLDLVLSGGFVHPDVNVALMLDGRRTVPDLRWPAQRLVVEADSRAWHEGKLAREDDAERQALLEAHGERVLRITWMQAIAQRPQTVARLRAAGAPSVE